VWAAARSSLAAAGLSFLAVADLIFYVFPDG
jgi:hypothetical protein